MKWPWVSRARYDDAIRQVGLMREREVEVQTSFTVLLDKFTALRLAGAAIEPKPVGPQAQPAREPDELKELIHEKCGGDYRKRGMMLRQLSVDRSARVPETQIRQAIEQGVQSDGVPA